MGGHKPIETLLGHKTEIKVSILQISLPNTKRGGHKSTETLVGPKWECLKPAEALIGHKKRQS